MGRRCKRASRPLLCVFLHPHATAPCWQTLTLALAHLEGDDSRRTHIRAETKPLRFPSERGPGGKTRAPASNYFLLDAAPTFSARCASPVHSAGPEASARRVLPRCVFLQLAVFCMLMVPAISRRCSKLLIVTYFSDGVRVQWAFGILSSLQMQLRRLLLTQKGASISL